MKSYTFRENKITLCLLLCMITTLHSRLQAQEKDRAPAEPVKLQTQRYQNDSIKLYKNQPPTGGAFKPNPAAQEKNRDTTEPIKLQTGDHQRDSIIAYKCLNPAKAALYSSVLPGLGQAYNKKYWKIPIVYTLMATSSYFIGHNNDKYCQMRNAFVTRINGGKDEFDNILKIEQIADRAREYERDRNIAMLFTAGFYILNILDALVDANLSEFNVNKDLSLAPVLIKNPGEHTHSPGLAMRFKF